MIQLDYLQRSLQTISRILLSLFVIWTLAVFGWYIQQEETEFPARIKYPKKSNENRKEAKQKVINEIMEERFEKYHGRLRRNYI